MTATREQELLIERLTEAHIETCPYTSDQIAVIMRRPHDISAILRYKNMDHEQLWLDCSHQLCNIILCVTQFARIIPSFMNLPLQDKILLIKAGCFEMSVLRMSRYVDHLTGYVIYGGIMIPSEVFTTADTSEMKLVNDTFQMAKSIADLKLSESELALYSAYVLFSPDHPGLRSDLEVQSYCQSILKALKSELDKTHKLYKGDVSVFDILIAQLTDLRDLSILHLEVLRKIMCFSPQLNFPPIYNELWY